MKPDDLFRIRHMIEAGESALRFITGRQRADLDGDEMLRFALVRAVEIVGEAASRISPDTRAGAPTVPWSAIVAMRNRLIHAYFDIDHDILWKTVTEEIPDLLPLLRSLLPTD
ncbi:DUF86 domain-containing protein (plasmid) [Azospirillum baldaniorum]|uniref:DUF86 domain-containing protein n=1 Tax=Azospirillum baldaniorum TaxID=1064539 RepID=A0A9P1NRN2_9PROT|nr:MULTISPECIES: HepT-like ribonuclease domain-containing protein [Azospirillum]AWJ94808.1 DUF86 domain-containing protein [Azospirillum baldaniorum]MBK3798686.1 DUF86 domain-containing protein [Azospirillum argentinense]TWA69790.1 uncharacterized protein with HEPN domain [Azospirillum brasilense]CCD03225.1 conserved protein of unknown function [Azospirillum baldaniorum]